MFNLSLIFGLIASAYLFGFVLLIKNAACAIRSAEPLPPGFPVGEGIPEWCNPEIQRLEQGVPVAGAVLRTPRPREAARPAR